MAQITHGMRFILNFPFIYNIFQNVMGAKSSRKHFVARSIRPFPGMKILDIGCGPAEILAYLPDIDYWGFDICERYIDYAQTKYAERGHFHCRELQLSDLEELPQFDVVLALGVLHHCDDQSAIKLMQIAAKALKPNGILLTIDPCLDPAQNRIARFLILHDRGQNVRDETGYRALAKAVFNDFRVEVRHKKWIPYSRCFMECRN